jgi:hypothetical protein
VRLVSIDIDCVHIFQSPAVDLVTMILGGPQNVNPSAAVSTTMAELYPFTKV